MKKTQAMASLEDLQKHSLINNLKIKIEELKSIVKRQEQTIEQYKRNTKTTIINEQEIEIQKLNDENKRLLLIIEEIRDSRRQSGGERTKYQLKGEKKKKSLKTLHSLKKPSNVESKLSEDTTGPENKKRSLYEQKYHEILIENQNLHKKLIDYKTQETLLKKKNLNDRSSILLEKNINELDKSKQKAYEIEADLISCLNREKRLKGRIDELEELLEKAMRINTSMKDLNAVQGTC